MKAFPFTEVTWLDAKFSSEWEAKDELVEPGICHTRGWLVKETKKYLVLAMTVGDDSDKSDRSHEDVVGTCAIPKGMVIKRRKLRVRYGR